MAPSSRGLGHRPFKPETGIRIPLGLPIEYRPRAFSGRIAQWESTCFTRKGSVVQIHLRPPGAAVWGICRWGAGRPPSPGRGRIAQLVERLLYTQVVTGSNPVSPIEPGKGPLPLRIAKSAEGAEPWCSWLAHWPVKPEVAGSSPVGSATRRRRGRRSFPSHTRAGLAQVVERGTENPGVPSSTLGPGTTIPTCAATRGRASCPGEGFPLGAHPREAGQKGNAVRSGRRVIG